MDKISHHERCPDALQTKSSNPNHTTTPATCCSFRSLDLGNLARARGGTPHPADVGARLVKISHPDPFRQESLALQCGGLCCHDGVSIGPIRGPTHETSEKKDGLLITGQKKRGLNRNFQSPFSNRSR